MHITGLLHIYMRTRVHADLRCKTILSESGAMESKTLNLCVKRLDRSHGRVVCVAKNILRTLGTEEARM